MHDTPHRDAGVQPVLECPTHGSWIKFDMVFLRLMETLEALGVQEKRAVDAEVERDGLRAKVAEQGNSAKALLAAFKTLNEGGMATFEFEGANYVLSKALEGLT